MPLTTSHVVCRCSTIRRDRWDKVFKSGPRKICGRQPLKNLKGYGKLKDVDCDQSLMSVIFLKLTLESTVISISELL